MEYICKSKSKLTNSQISELNKLCILKHIAKFKNIYIIETNNIETVETTSYFSSIRQSRVFQLAKTKNKINDVVFEPAISNQEFLRYQMYGWNTKVAVFDSGVIKQDCPKLNENESKDFTDMGNIIVNPHGTIVSKVINYFAPGSQIISIKIAHNGEDILEGNIIRGIDYCIENNNIDLINMSFELPHNEECRGDCDICDYIDLASEVSGITVVVASGNQGQFDGITVGCPGRAENVVTVGQVSNEYKVEDTSGKGIAGFDKPNLIAPGTVKVAIGNKIFTKSGTSFAAPVVTGILSAITPYYNDKSLAIEHLYKSCDDLSLPSYEQGNGLLNITTLLEVLENEQTVSNSSSR